MSAVFCRPHIMLDRIYLEV